MSEQQISSEDPWPDWYPYEQHAPLLDGKKHSRDRPSMIKRLEKDGIVVITGIIDPRECEELTADLASWLKKKGGIDFQDNRTWENYNANHMDMSETILGMMNTGPACFSSAALKARSSPRVVEVAKTLYGVESEEDLLMELQGVFWGFPPEYYPQGRIPAAPHGGYYHWSSMWMHSDRGRQTFWPPKLQSTLLLEEVELYDHAFAFLSKSHYYHDEFFTKHPPGSLNLEDESTAKKRKDNYIQLTYDELKYFEDRGCRWKKVVAPKGSLIIWDSRLIHSTCTPSRGRPRPKPRFIVYGSYVPRLRLTEEEIEHRQTLLETDCNGLDRQVMYELWQRNHGRLKKLMGFDDYEVKEECLALTSFPNGQRGQEEEKAEAEEEDVVDGQKEEKLQTKIESGDLSSHRKQQHYHMIIQGVEGAWSQKERDAAKALLLIVHPASPTKKLRS